MDRLLDQLRFHPGMALVAVSIFVAGVVLVGLKKAERPGLLPKMLGLALLAGAFGVAGSVRHLFGVFHGMALVGSAGYGALGAGLGECDGALLLGLAPALLTLGLGLAFARGAADGGLEPGGRQPKPMPPWILICLTLLAVVVVILGAYDLWLLRLVSSLVLTRSPAPAAGSGGVEAVSQTLSDHLVRLGFLGHGAVVASGALIIALFVSGPRVLSRRQTLWTRSLAAGLAILCLIGILMAWRQFTVFYEVALTGQPLSATMIP